MVDVRQLVAESLERKLAAVRVAVWTPLPHQVPPEGDWEGWLLLAGRGAGKTDACANYMNKHALGPPCLPGRVPHAMGIVGPTSGDAVTSGYQGPSGLRAHNPETVLKVEPGGTFIRWPNGAECKVFGASTQDDIERLRSGGNRCLFWLEELAAWRYLQDGYDQMSFGLRSGRRPRWIGSTTPKPRPLIKELAGGKVEGTVITTGITTDDNPHLPGHIRRKLFKRYSGTSKGAQELYGRVIDEDENALWRREQVERYRLPFGTVKAEELRSITVGVDPSGGAGEQGIVVVGRNGEMGFVLADYTCTKSPDEWGRQAVTAALDWQADDIVVETNFGGEMAKQTIVTAVRLMGAHIPVRVRTASRGKRVRAEPVSALAANGLVRHVGEFPELEDQLCTWTDDADYSPDRLDAMVWGVHHLGLVTSAFSSVGSIGGSTMAGRSLTGQRG